MNKSGDSVNEPQYEDLLNIYRNHKRGYIRKGIGEAGVASVTTKGGKRSHGPFSITVKIALVSLVVTMVLTAGAGLVIRKVSVVLAEAARHRQRLETLQKAVGLDKAFDVVFNTKQPNIVIPKVSINTALVRLAAVTYDSGESWQTLYSKTIGDVSSSDILEPTIIVEDEKIFTKQTSGKRTVTVRVHVEYVPEVIAAFPEFNTLDKKDKTGLYELTAKGIIKLIGSKVPTAKPEISMGIIPLSIDRWEILNSPSAHAYLTNDPISGDIIQQFNLVTVGEYINISHAIPGATAANSSVSLEELTAIEIQLLWNGDSPVTLEPKLVDNNGKTIGVTKLIEPGSQTIRIPLRSLKGYWGIRSFGLNQVRRFELAVACKAKNHATDGTIEIQRIELLGTSALTVADTITTSTKLLAELPLEPAEWDTAHSERGVIELFSENGMLVCKVALPYDEVIDEILPWTNLEIKIKQQDFSKLQEIELELMWQGDAPVTLEPKLVTSLIGDTYGRQIIIQPGTQYHKVIVYPQDLKYYWSIAGASETTKLNLHELNSISLGIARKAQNQAQQGILYIKTVRLLAPAVGIN